MVRQIQGKLLAAGIMAGLKKIDLPGVDFATAKQFAQAAFEATRNGKLGYTLMVAKKIRSKVEEDTVIRHGKRAV